MSKNNLPKGKLGEDLACRFLQKKGYRIIARNFRTSWDELDIVAIFSKRLIFVEVKTRWSKAYGSAFAAITFWKLKRLKRAAQYFAMTHPQYPQSLRIDAIAIQMNAESKPVDIEHLTNITV